MHPPHERPSGWEVLASIGDSLMVMDRDYRVIWYREPLINQYRPGAKVVGETCHQVFFGRDTPCPQDCPVRPVFAGGLPQVVERHAILPDGSECWREARAFPIVDRRGRVAFVARISFDITHRKQQEGRRERDLEGLERSLMETNRLAMGELPFQPDGGPGLTRRELEVLRLVAQGLSNPRMARVLGISPHTVKRHVVNIFNKLGVGDRAQAAVWAARRGLV